LSVGRRVRRAVILLAAVVAVSLLAGCARDGGDPQSERTHAEQEEQIPSKARIFCLRNEVDDAPSSATKENEAHNDGTLTRVLTPKVAAQPDGVHYVIDNRIGVDSSYTVEFPSGGGIGDILPKGESRHTEPFSPGVLINISCDPPGYEGKKDLEYASFEVLKGDSGYKSRSLQCSGGGQVHGIPASGGNLKRDPVELARRYFNSKIEESDVVEIAGYPELAYSRIHGYQRYVRVVRHGRVVAVIRYIRFRPEEGGGGWIRGGTFECESFLN
jgi:hypothetical protein